MKVALVGSTGYIAGFLQKRFESEGWDILPIGRREPAEAVLHLEEAEQFDYSVLEDVDAVVFTAAVSGPDKCANEFEDCWRVNVTGTEHFIREAVARGCRVLFFSSDAVFGDIPGAVYTEQSETAAATPYGRMKKAVEDAFRGQPRFKAIRLPYVVSARDRFVSGCLAAMESGTETELFHPFYRNCVVVSDVADAVVWLLKNWEIYAPAVLNVAGRELVSRVRIADELNRIFGGRLKYRIVDPGAAFFQNRPRITEMRSLYLEKLGIVNGAGFSEKIRSELT